MLDAGTKTIELNTSKAEEQSLSNSKLELMNKLAKDEYISERKAQGNFVCDNRNRYDEYKREYADKIQEIGFIVCYLSIFSVIISFLLHDIEQDYLFFNFYAIIAGYCLILLGYFDIRNYLFDFGENELIYKSKFFLNTNSYCVKFCDIRTIGVSVPYYLTKSGKCHFYYEIFMVYTKNNSLNYAVIEKGDLGLNNCEKLEEVNIRAKLFADRFEKVEFCRGEAGMQREVVDGELIVSNKEQKGELLKIRKYLFYPIVIAIIVLGFVLSKDWIKYDLYNLSKTTINKVLNSVGKKAINKTKQ